MCQPLPDVARRRHEVPRAQGGTGRDDLRLLLVHGHGRHLFGAQVRVVDALQDAQSVSDYDQLEDLASDLATQGARFGYPELSEVSEHVCGACKDRDSATAQEWLMELTEVSRRMRLGHRGAA